MTYFSRRRGVYALAVILAVTTAPYLTRSKASQAVDPDSRPRTATEPAATAAAAVQTTSGRLPLSFEANLGQSGDDVKFLSHNRGYSVSLAPTEAVITLQPPRPHRRVDKQHIGDVFADAGGRPQSVIDSPQSTVLRLQLVGANSRAMVSGVNKLPGLVNYISGQDQTQWRTG